MVLTDDNYVSIVAAVEQGRVIYANIRKFVFFLLSSNIAEIMIIFLATLAGLPMPLTVIQLLWLNLLTDGAPALALAMEKGDPDIMERPPRPKSESIVNSSMRLGMVIQTIAQTGAVLGAFLLGLYWHLGAQIPAGENILLYLLRTTGAGWMCRPPRRWPLSPCRCASCSVPTPCAPNVPPSSGWASSPTRHAVRGWLIHGPAAAGGQCALPAADLQHPLPGCQRMAGRARPGALPGDRRRDHQALPAHS